MSAIKVASWLQEHFSLVEDPRTGNRKEHALLDVIGLTVVAVLCGADDFTAIEAFGKARLEWLRQIIPLTNGVPSHDTLGRCFALMNAEQVSEGFTSWVNTLVQRMDGEIVAIDGKCLRGSHEVADNKYAIHLVSAWAVENGLCLGQQRVDEKSNEITAIPKLLALLDLKDCTVTIDAMGTQKAIAQQIRGAGADYVLALKGNHPELYEEVVSSFAHLAGSAAYPFAQQWETGHGRVESRRCCVIDVTASDFDWIMPEDLAAWTGLSSLIMVEAKRWVGMEQSTLERRYYLSSLKASENDAARFNQVVRAHWGVENSLHWCLDVAFNEDRSRVRKGQADANLSIVRRLVINLLRNEKSAKLGIKNKRLRAGWDEAYLVKVLTAGDS